MKRIAIPVIASLTLAVGAAWAHDKRSFDALDRNNDGKLSRAEYSGVAPKKVKARPAADPGFNRLDRNNDGYLSRAEASRNGYLIERFNAADKNDDDRLNRAEYLAVMTKKDVRSGVAKLEQRRDQRSAAAGTTRQPSLP
jgi:hypothetical protein